MQEINHKLNQAYTDKISKARPDCPLRVTPEYDWEFTVPTPGSRSEEYAALGWQGR